MAVASAPVQSLCQLIIDDRCKPSLYTRAKHRKERAVCLLLLPQMNVLGASGLIESSHAPVAFDAYIQIRNVDN